MSIPLQVLIIEDSEPDAMLLLRHLKQGGYEPESERVETLDGLRAALAARDWDVIIADYRLLNFTGLDALRLVQESEPDVPFILVSSAIGEEQATAVMKAGAHEFLLKDRLAQLPLAVERELEDAAERRRRRQAEEALRRSEQFALSQWAEAEGTLQAIPANIAIVNEEGVILRVNRAWSSFAGKNGTTIGAVAVGVNYLEMCETATGAEAVQARAFADGIRSVISGQRERFSMEYACHSPTEERWFMGYVTLAPMNGAPRVVIAHVDITEQKIIEEQIISLNHELESRVVERTAELRAAVDALEKQISERRRLESEVLKISEYEQSRIGRDLHDGACQNIACIAVLADVAARDLDRENSLSADRIREISQLARQSVEEVRRLAAGLFPVKFEQQGLEEALQDLASGTSTRSQIDCSFVMREPIAVKDQNAAIQLYRIAQEALSNAVRHGRASKVAMELSANHEKVNLTISDDGTGILDQSKKGGIGLHTMEYRAKMLGGSLEVKTEAGRGTTVICSFPGKEFVNAKDNA